MAEFIRLENLTHIYHENTPSAHIALHDINLTIQEGEFVAVIGTNGSGKSTLARHLNALLLPTSGKCVVAGLDTRLAEELWKIRRTVGMVFQNPDNQIIATVVEEDVAFGPENIGVPSEEIRRRVDEALRAVDMEDYRRHAPHMLSGGQKQRVAIAGTLAMKTQCIVLDEPTAMLDPKARLEVLDTIKKLHRTMGITVVHITHFMDEAVYADRVVIMEKGKIYATGAPKEIFSDAERLKNVGLDVPVAAQIAYELKKTGMNLPADIVTNEELAVALCQFL